MATTRESYDEVRIRLTGGIYTHMDTAMKVAGALGGNIVVSFEFNGRIFMVRPDSDSKLIMRDFFRPHNITGTSIGPYPDPINTELDEQLALERGSNFASVLIPH